MDASVPNVSDDLLWLLTKKNNCHIVKRYNQQFSTHSLNLMSKNSRKYHGYNSRALGVIPNEKGGVVVIRKNEDAANKPAKSTRRSVHGIDKSRRRIYKAVAGMAAKPTKKDESGYRGDLRKPAVAKVSAICRSQRPLRPSPPEKLRGAKARKEAAKEA